MQSFLTETDLIPSWATEMGLSRCFVYTGPSMRPTFWPGDLLFVRPDVCDLLPGDIIVFTVSLEWAYVVHRVVAITPYGLLTRGDGNRFSDPFSTDIGSVIGRVEMIGGAGWIRAVHGGVWGLRRAQVCWVLNRLRVYVWRMGAPLYRILRRQMLLRHLPSYFLRHIQVVRYQAAGGVVLKALHQGRTVAEWWPEQNVFRCRKPYDLVLRREDLLPSSTIPSTERPI